MKLSKLDDFLTKSGISEFGYTLSSDEDYDEDEDEVEMACPPDDDDEENEETTSLNALLSRKQNFSVKKKDGTNDFVCWSKISANTFAPSPTTVNSLPPGVYKIKETNKGIMFEISQVVTDSIFELADSDSKDILDKIELFWSKQEAYKKFKIIFKRGVLLYGPPGSGKTITCLMLAKKIIEKGGIVIITETFYRTGIGLHLIRQIEPDRPIVNIIEDIDSIIKEYGDSYLLPLLDGEDQIENIVHVATTNYPQTLEKRLVNRPSRFDEIRRVDAPNEKIREKYFRALLSEHVDEKWFESNLKKWVNDTKGMSMAHLKELVIAVMCLDREYVDVIEQLKLISTKKLSETESGKVGF